jgi:hypothetical protein
MKMKAKSLRTTAMRISLLLLGFLFVLLASCDKDDDPQPEYGVPVNYVDSKN